MSAIFIEILADYLLFPIILIGAVVLLRVPAKNRREVWAKAIIAGLLALVFAKIASLFYQGQRPFEDLGVDPGAAFLPNAGFPSDHILLAVIIACIVWAITKNKALSILLLVLCILLGCGRILALVHYPIDVIGGAACAILAALCVYGKNLFTAKVKV